MKVAEMFSEIRETVTKLECFITDGLVEEHRLYNQQKQREIERKEGYNQCVRSMDKIMKNIDEQYPLIRAINLASIEDIFKILEEEGGTDIKYWNDSWIEKLIGFNCQL